MARGYAQRLPYKVGPATIPATSASRVEGGKGDESGVSAHKTEARGVGVAKRPHIRPKKRQPASSKKRLPKAGDTASPSSPAKDTASENVRRVVKSSDRGSGAPAPSYKLVQGHERVPDDANTAAATAAAAAAATGAILPKEKNGTHEGVQNNSPKVGQKKLRFKQQQQQLKSGTVVREE